MDQDVVVMYGAQKDILANPVFKRLDAVREDRVIYLDLTDQFAGALGFALISLPYLLDQSEDMFAAASTATRGLRSRSRSDAWLARARQSKYAIDLTEARRVIADHGWARVVTVGAEGLRATYGFFLLEDSEEDEVGGRALRAGRSTARGHRGADAGAADLRGAARVRVGLVVPPGADGRPEHDEPHLRPPAGHAGTARR